MASTPQNRSFQAIPDQSAKPAVATQSADDENFDYLMSIADRVKRRNAALEDGSILQDLGRGVLTTLAQTGGAFGFVAEMAGIPGGKAVREAAESAVQHWQDGISAQFKASQNKKFLSDEEGKIFGPGATDPRKIVDLVISNLPFMLVGGGLGLGATKVLLGRAAAKAAGAGATKAQIAAAAKALTRGQVAKAGVIGGGLGEGLVAAPLNAQQAFEEAMRIPYSTMAKTQAFKDAYHALPDDMPVAERMEKSRVAVARTASAWVGIMTGASTFILGAPSGVWLARLIRSPKGKNVFSTMAKGFVLEGPGQELPQTLAEELATGLSINILADPDRRLMGDDLAENLVGAVVAGGITGATIGAAGAQGSDDAGPPGPPDRPDPELEEAKADSTEEQIREILGLDKDGDEREPQPLDVGDAMEIKGEPQDATEANLPVGVVARKTSPDGEVFTGRVVARATQDMNPEEAQAAGLDLEFVDADGNPVETVSVPGAVLRRDEETRFVADGEQVQVLDEDEAIDFNNRRDISKKESQIANQIPKEFAKLREQIPVYLKKYPDGKAVDLKDKDVVALQRTIEEITEIIGPERARQIVSDMIEGLNREAPGKTAKFLKKEGKAISEEQGAQTVKQLKKRRAELNKKATELGAKAAKTSPLGFLAAAKSSDAGTAGINKAAAEAEGIDTEGRLNVGGRTVFTKDGMSMDAAAELLNESGQFGKDITANDVVDIIADQLAGRPNKFSGDSAAIAQEAAKATTELEVVEDQITALKAKKEQEFETARQTQRNADELFGGGSLAAIEDKLREKSELERIYSEAEYFATINKDEVFRTLTDLIALAEAHNSELVDELLNTKLTDHELAQALLEIIDDEQITLGEGEETAGEPETEAVDDEGSADAEESTEPPAEPETTAEPADKPEVGEDTTAPPPGTPADETTAPPPDVTPPIVPPEGEDNVGEEPAVEDETDAEKAEREAARLAKDQQKIGNRFIKAMMENPAAVDDLESRSDAIMLNFMDVQSDAYKAIFDKYIAPRLNEEYDSAIGTGDERGIKTINSLSATGVDGEFLFSEQDAIFTQAFYRNLVKKAINKNRKKNEAIAVEARKEVVNKEIVSRLATIRADLEKDGKELPNEEWQELFSKGFWTVINGDSKSNLPPHAGANVGYQQGVEWLDTEEGRAAAGTRKKKEKIPEGKGIRIRRIVDIMREAKNLNDVEAAVDKVLNETKPAKLMTPNYGEEGATPGLQRFTRDVVIGVRSFAIGFAEDMGLPGWKKSGDAILEFVEDNPEKNLALLTDAAETWAEALLELADTMGRGGVNRSKGFGDDITIDSKYTLADTVNAMWFDLITPETQTNRDQYYFRSTLTSLGERINLLMRRDIRKIIKQQNVDIFLGDELKEHDPRKPPPRRPAMAAASREGGVDYRNGKDATVDDYDKFNFGAHRKEDGSQGTSVQFGSYTGKDGDRLREHINFTHDSLLDLAVIMGIKPSDLSFGGELFMSIASLGTGLRDAKASAWFQPKHPDRGVPVINIINRRGDGALGHELAGHGLDFLIQGDHGRAAINKIKAMMKSKITTTPADYITLLINWHHGDVVYDENNKQVVWKSPTVGGGGFDSAGGDRQQRLRDLQLAIDKEIEKAANRTDVFFSFWAIAGRTNFMQASLQLDGFTEGKYWSQPEELYARATEAFLLKKMDDAKISNNYLVNDAFVNAADRGIWSVNPYPVDQERDLFNALLEKLWSSITWTENGPVIENEVDFSEVDPSHSEFIKEFKELGEDIESTINTIISDAEKQAEGAQTEASEQKKKDDKERRDAWEEGRADDLNEDKQTPNHGDKDAGSMSADDWDELFEDAAAEADEAEQGVSQDASGKPTSPEQGGDPDAEEGGPEGTAGVNVDPENPPDQPPEGLGGAVGNGGIRRPGGTSEPATGKSGRRRTGVSKKDKRGPGRSGRGAAAGVGAAVGGAGRGTGGDRSKLSDESLDELAKDGIEVTAELENALSDLLDVDLGTTASGGDTLASIAPEPFNDDHYEILKPKFIRTIRAMTLEQTDPISVKAAAVKIWLMFRKQGQEVGQYMKKFMDDTNAGLIPEMQEAMKNDRRNAGKGTDTGKKEELLEPEVTKGQDLGAGIFERFSISEQTKAKHGDSLVEHPGTLDESAAMQSAKLPKNDYVLSDMTVDGIWKRNDDGTYSFKRGSFDPVESGALSGAQVEYTEYAGHAHSQVLPDGVRKGIANGDGTGVGKGREIAAVIRDNINNGRKKHIWLSAGVDLLSSAQRDMADIGGNPNDIVTQVGSDANKSILDGSDGTIFTTYKTLSWPAKGNKKSRLQQLVDELGDTFDGVIALDEVHKASLGQASQDKDATKQAIAIAALHEAFPMARFMYVSATIGTGVNNLKVAERLGIWGKGTPWEEGAESFVAAMVGRGRGAMELVARNLKEMGVYFARALSWNDGTERGTVVYGTMQTNTSNADREQYEAFTKLWVSVRSEIGQAIRTSGLSGIAESSFGDPRTQAAAKKKKKVLLQVQANTRLRFFNQVITTLKTNTMIQHIMKVSGWNPETKEFEKEGDAILIQMAQTDDAPTKRAALRGIEAGLSEETGFEVTPKELIRDYLDKWFPTHRWTTAQQLNKTTGLMETVMVPDLDHPVEGLMVVKADLIARLDGLEAYKNPIDAVLATFGDKNVAEITGRKKRFLSGTLRADTRSEADIAAEVDDYMDDRRRILIFSEKGGTGASYHADLTRKNQRQRQHYLLQGGWKAATAIQGLGRGHRSNQASAPIIWLLTSDIAAEKRFISTIAARLEDLGAMTRGQRETGSQGLFGSEFNIHNRFTMAALRETYESLRRSGAVRTDGTVMLLSAIESMTGLKIVGGRQAEVLENPPDMRQFLNGLLALPIDVQNSIFQKFDEAMARSKKRAEELGTLEVGLEVIPADSIKVEHSVVVHSKDGLDTRYVKLALSWHKKAMTFDEFKELMLSLNYESIKFGINVVNASNERRAQLFALVRMKNGNMFTYTPWPHKATDRRMLSVKKEAWTETDSTFERRNLTLDTSEGMGEARKAWDEQVKRWDEVMDGKVSESRHMITGAVLPIWDRLVISGDIKAQKAILDRIEGEEGPQESLIGLPILKDKDLLETLQRLGASGVNRSPQEILDGILEGSVATLSNGDTISLLTAEKDPGRVEIIIRAGGQGAAVYADFNIEETTDFGQSFKSAAEGGFTRFIIEKSGAVNKLEAILRRFPLASLTNESEVQEDAFKEDETEIASADLKLAKIGRHELPRHMQTKYTTDGVTEETFIKITGKTFENKEKIKAVSHAQFWNDAQAWVIPESQLKALTDSVPTVFASLGGIAAGMDQNHVVQQVKKLRAVWGFAPRVTVVGSQNEIPADVLARIAGKSAPFAGLYDSETGTVWIVADHLAGPSHLGAVIAHEIFGHFGLRMYASGKTGANMRMVRMLQRIYATYKNDPIMLQIAEDYGFDLSDPAQQPAAADEFYAKLIEKFDTIEEHAPKERALIRRIIAEIRLFLSKLPLIGEFIGNITNDELMLLMRKTRHAATNGVISTQYKMPSAGERADVMLSRVRPAVIYGINEAGAIKAAAVQDSDGDYTFYTTQGGTLHDGSPLRKDRVGSRSAVTKRMNQLGLTQTLRGKNFGPPRNSGEIHMNFTIPDETRWDRLLSTFQDRFRRLLVTQEAFREQGAGLDPDTDTYRAEERFHGLVFERIRKFEDTLVKPLLESISAAGKEFGVTIDQVDDYLYAKHVPEANARLQKLNPNVDNNGELSGHSNEWAAQIIAGVEANDLTSVMESIVQQVYAINNKRLELLVREGLINQKSATAMRKAYQFYVPLRGKSERQADIDGADDIGISPGKGLSAAGRERHRFGRQSPAKDMLIQSVLMMEETLIRVEKNRVGKTFLKFIQRFPNSDQWTVNRKSRKPRWDKQLGEIVHEARSYPPETMVVWVDGKEHQIFIADPILRRAMLSLNVVQVNSIVQAIAKVTRFLAAVNTSFNPEFAIPNLLRDIGAALVNLQDTELLQKHGLNSEEGINKIARGALKDLMPALRGAWFGLRGEKLTDKSSATIKEWANWFDDFRAQGGKIEFFSMSSVEGKRKELRSRLARLQRGRLPVIDQLVWLKDWVSDMNGAIENGIRLSTYKNLVEQGVDKRVAASVARNLTVNFNRKGEVSNFMNAMFMFFNAGVQGTTRLFLAAKNKKVQKILMSLVAGSFLLAEMARWTGGEDEDGENYYDKIPDWVKEHNLILMKADGSGGYYKFPLPYGYNVMNVIGVMANKIYHIGRDDGLNELTNQIPGQAVRLISATLNAFNPVGGDGGLLQMASPTVLDPFVQIASNENFFGAPIRPVQPTYLQYEKPQSELYWSSATPISKDIAKWLNTATGGNSFKSGWVDYSPEDMDHIFAFMFGGAGAFVIRSTNYAYAVAKDEPVSVREIPIVRRFAASSPEFVVPGKYRENVSELLQITNSLKEARRSGDSTGARAIAGDNKKVIGLAGFLNSSQSRLRKLRSRRRKIQDSKLPETVKRIRVEAINEQIDSIQKKFNKRFKEARKAS